MIIMKRVGEKRATLVSLPPPIFDYHYQMGNDQEKKGCLIEYSPLLAESEKRTTITHLPT